jgi:SIT4-associating protein SAP185/190
MLWRFSFATTSSLDNLLSRETPPTLEEVMDEQDVLAECKAQNNKCVETVSSPLALQAEM